MARRLVVAVLILVSWPCSPSICARTTRGRSTPPSDSGLATSTRSRSPASAIARPFQDAYGYVSDLATDKADRDTLQARIRELETEAALAQAALEENARLRELLQLVEGPAFSPTTRRSPRGSSCSRPARSTRSSSSRRARTSGVARNAPVVTAGGDLVGLVTNVTGDSSQVTLLTDQSLNVSAVVLGSGARGIVSATQSGSALVLDRVGKDEVVREGEHRRHRRLAVGRAVLPLPAWIRIGTVTSVGQRDIDLFKQIQVAAGGRLRRSVRGRDPRPAMIRRRRQGSGGRDARGAAPGRLRERVRARRGAGRLRRCSCSSRSRCSAGPCSARSRDSGRACSIDVATLGTLGLTSLLLTLPGYAAGRIGDATSDHENQKRADPDRDRSRDGRRRHRLARSSTCCSGTPPRSDDRARRESLLPTLVLNVVLAFPTYWALPQAVPAAVPTPARPGGGGCLAARSSHLIRASRSRTGSRRGSRSGSRSSASSPSCSSPCSSSGSGRCR